MSILNSLLISVIIFFSNGSFSQEPPIIPLPNSYRQIEGSFKLGEQTSIRVRDSIFENEAEYLKNNILKITGISTSGKPGEGREIVLSKGSDDFLHKKGGYSLEIGEDRIGIKASTQEGMFYGVVSLLQITSKLEVKEQTVSIEGWTIQDSPLYKWRGFMLDESRHFFGKEVIKDYLDELAWLKLNKFHWHITDSDGWRLEIKKYPLLSLIGGLGNYSNKNEKTQYYSQEDIREIISYAKERHIEIIPEIDMPGHATAANRAYPEYSGGGTEEFPDFTFNPGKESTYSFLTDVISEISVLFPTKRIHLGGDEVSFGIKGWGKDKGVQELMKRKNLDDLKDVEHYFFKRMVDSSLTRFNEVLAWDEAVDGDLSPDNTLIYWWRHDLPEQLDKALGKGFDIILSPRTPLYFDFVQDSSHIQGRKWGEAFSPIQDLYDLNENDLTKNSKAKEQIKGLQANLWTERVKSKKRLDFMTFPRITALAESSWTYPENKDYDSFLLRLEDQLVLYEKENIFYFNPMDKEKTPEVIDQGIELNLN